MDDHRGFQQRDTADDITWTSAGSCILAVDDEESTLLLEKEMMELLGYEVVATTSSIDALEEFRSEPERFDLVITDMNMPNMSGVELTQNILSLRCNFPVILCTGSTGLIDEKKALSIGITAYLAKPFTLARLAETVRGITGRSSKK